MFRVDGLKYWLLPPASWPNLWVQNTSDMDAGGQVGRLPLIQYGVSVAFGLFYTIVTILQPGFFRLGNLSDILIETSIISFVSFGEASGDFDKAVQSAREAIDLARKGENTDLAGELGKRLSLYQKQTPFRE